MAYFNGEGVAKDVDKAIQWFRNAAEQGHAESQCVMGMCYEEGVGVVQDTDEAIKWYRKAAAQGEVNAFQSLKNLGVL